MYICIEIVMGFGFAMDGFNLLAPLEAKGFETKLCMRATCGIALPDRQGLSSGLRAREAGEAEASVPRRVGSET